MIENKKNELRDYLYKIIQKMGLSESELSEMSTYTDDLIESFAPVFKLIESDKNKDLFAKSMSSLIEEMNVKRNS